MLQNYLGRNWLDHPSFGMSEPTITRMSQATRAAHAASPSPEMRGHLQRNWLDHLVRDMSEASLAGPPQVRTYRIPDLRGRLRRHWPRKLHLRAQKCEDVSSETGRTSSRAASDDVSGRTVWTTTGQGIFEPRAARPLHAKLARKRRAVSLNSDLS